MKKIIFLLLSLFAISCLGGADTDKNTSSSTSYEAATLTKGGKVSVYKLKPDGSREEIYAGSADEFNKRTSASGDEIFLIEIKNFSYISLDTGEELAPPSEITWRTMTKKLDKSVLNSISPITTWAADSALILIENGFSPVNAYNKTFGSMSYPLGTEEISPSTINPYTAASSEEPGYIHGLIILGMERHALRASKECGSNNRWNVYFNTIAAWDEYIKSKTDGSFKSVTFPCSNNEINSGHFVELIADGIGEAYLKSNTINRVLSTQQLSDVIKKLKNATPFPMAWNITSFDNDFIPPTIEASGISDGDVLNSNKDIMAKAKPFYITDEISYIGIAIDNEIISGEINTNSINTTISPTDFIPGSHEIKILARDGSGNIALKNIVFKINDQLHLINVSIADSSEGQILIQDNLYKVKGNFVLKTAYTPKTAGETIRMVSTDPELESYFEGASSSAVEEDGKIYLQVTVPAESDSIHTDPSGLYNPSIIELWKDSAEKSEKLDSMAVYILNYPPTLSVKTSGKGCSKDKELFICKHANELNLFIKIISEFTLNQNETSISITDHAGAYIPQSCEKSGDNNFLCTITPNISTADGPLTIKVNLKENGISPQTITAENVIIDNHFLDHQIDITQNARKHGNAVRYTGGVADLNGDGLDDIVVYGERNEGEFDRTKESAWAITIYWNDLKDPFSRTTVFGMPLETTTIKSVTLCDVGSDGWMDIIAADPFHNGYRGRLIIFFGPFGKDTTPVTSEVKSPTDYYTENSEFGSFVSCAAVLDDTCDYGKQLLVGFKDSEDFGRYWNKSTYPSVLLYGTLDMWHNGVPQSCNLPERDSWEYSMFHPKDIGDVNGDGWNDVGSITDGWQTQILWGPIANTNGKCNGKGFGPVIRDVWTTREIHPLGDINKDGIADFAIGRIQPKQDDTSYREGKVTVFLGRKTWKDSPVPDLVITGDPSVENSSFGFGSGDVVAGDFDADGIKDIAIGSHNHDDGEGMISVFFGTMPEFCPSCYSVDFEQVENIINTRTKMDHFGHDIFVSRHLNIGEGDDLISFMKESYVEFEDSNGMQSKQTGLSWALTQYQNGWSE